MKNFSKDHLLSTLFLLLIIAGTLGFITAILFTWLPGIYLFGVSFTASMGFLVIE